MLSDVERQRIGRHLVADLQGFADGIAVNIAHPYDGGARIKLQVGAGAYRYALVSDEALATIYEIMDNHNKWAAMRALLDSKLREAAASAENWLSSPFKISRPDLFP